MNSTVLLITGGSGFLGQHLVRVIQEKGENIREIRLLDLVPFQNKFITDYERVPIKMFIGDITDINDECRKAFEGVDAVLHCAAFVSYEFPPDTDKLDLVNVEGTRNVIELCLKYNIQRLIYTSTAEVSVRPYFKNGFFGVQVNETESKALPPDDEGYVFGYYAHSKLRGEEIALHANGTKHYDGNKCLRTTALRPTILYGEHDEGFLAMLMDLGSYLGHVFPRVGGPGGKHQVCYAGNAAWAQLRALQTLQDNPASVEGLPVFITDDTYISDILHFNQRILTPETGKPLISPSWWYIPSILCFIVALICEFSYKFIGRVCTPPKLTVSPKTIVIYLGSVVFFNRLRAIIHLNYKPIYQQVDVSKACGDYYTKRILSKRNINCK